MYRYRDREENTDSTTTISNIRLDNVSSVFQFFPAALNKFIILEYNDINIIVPGNEIMMP